MNFPSSVFGIFTVIAAVGCTSESGEPLANASESASTEEATPFAGAWQFEGNCTSKGASAPCSAFARINAIPKAMHFYDDGRKAAIMYLPFGETNPKAASDLNGGGGEMTESDPVTWPAYAASSDGRLVVGTVSFEIPYRLHLSGSTLAYCFDSEKTCASLAKKGAAAKGLEERLARYAKGTPTKLGNVSYACDRRDEGLDCTDHIFETAFAYFSFEKKRCDGAGRELRSCPPEAKKTGCRLKLLGVTQVSWSTEEKQPSEYCEVVRP